MPGATSTNAPDTSGAAGAQFAGLTGGAGVGSSFEAVNMIGDLLRSSTSVRYLINRAQGGAEVNAFGATRAQNAAIAENNSPEPRDRLSFRYNYFHKGQSVTGLNDGAVYTPALGVGVYTQGTEARDFDTNLYNFSFEKTFFDRLLSVEARLPFQSGLSPTLNLRQSDNPQMGNAQVATPRDPRVPGGVLYGYYNPSNNAFLTSSSSTPPAGFTRLQAFAVRQGGNPAETRGSESDAFGNMSVILKGLLYETPGLLVSGGLGFEVPTAPDSRVRIVDYVGGQTSIFAEVQRVRDFLITNDTWALSPFLAVLATPTDRFFGQGFLQFEFPVTSSTYTYSDTFPRSGTRSASNPSFQFNPVTQVGTINEQPLLHLDVGAGYWLVRNPEARWLNGVAPSVELHYVTTLRTADVITLPGDNTYARVGGSPVRTTQGPQLGNLNNRVDILDLTLVTTFLVSHRAMLAAAVVLPLKGSTDRTFDWEFQLQFNLYFGGPGQRGLLTPNF